MAVLMNLNNNGQAITLSKKLADKGAVDGPVAGQADGRRQARIHLRADLPDRHPRDVAVLLAGGRQGINPMKDAKVITVPPPQMVANMRVGNMDGFCVGEPWNHRAIIDGIGVTAATTQDIWKDHPEKVLGTTADFVKQEPQHLARRDDGRARGRQAGSTPACEQEQDGRDHRRQGLRQHRCDAINQRILGRYQNGMGKTWDDPNHMKFFNDGAVNYPLPVRRHVVPDPAQALGPAEGPPGLPGSGQADQPDDLYKQAAAQLKISVPKSDMRSSKLIDGVVWDGKDPAKYADGFKVRARPPEEERTMVSAVFHSPLDAPRRPCRPRHRGRPPPAPPVRPPVSAGRCPHRAGPPARVRLARAGRCACCRPSSASPC
jgi:nitrate/nitrite transport system substrate-binding protein